jgi:hypothetical protein
MEMLVNRYLRDEALAQMPLHPNQHAYQFGKSVETALNQLVVRVEKALDQQETALGAFVDIEGAFNNTCYCTMCDVFVRHGVTTPLFGVLGPHRSGDPQWVFCEGCGIQRVPARGCAVTASVVPCGG